jgi:hypothetical protein
LHLTIRPRFREAERCIAQKGGWIVNGQRNTQTIELIQDSGWIIRSAEKVVRSLGFLFAGFNEFDQFFLPIKNSYSSTSLGSILCPANNYAGWYCATVNYMLQVRGERTSSLDSPVNSYSDGFLLQIMDILCINFI